MRRSILPVAGASVLALLVTASVSFAIVAGPFYTPIQEVPIERLLKNLKGKLRGSDYWQAFARIHLLAYVRHTKTLPAYTRGKDGDETLNEGPFKDCTPIARPPGDIRPIPKCTTQDTQFGYPAPRGLPEGTLAVRYPPDDHLKIARNAYERVRAMVPTRIRPRLALAYIYDRYGEMDKAISALRSILDEADRVLPKTPWGSDAPHNANWASADGYWDLQIVAAEAIEHLTLISKASEDRARIDTLRRKLEAPKKIMLFITPILVPLTKERSLVSFIDKSARVRFDFTGQGLPLEGGWIKDNAAWLVWDPDDKQRVTGGFQLFGSVTWMTPWRNGYVALSALDDNNDGKISGSELKGLSLWHDANGNGVCDPGEVKPVTDWKIVALAYRHKRTGKDWIAPRGATFSNGETRPTFDWNVETRLLTASR